MTINDLLILRDLPASGMAKPGGCGKAALTIGG